MSGQTVVSSHARCSGCTNNSANPWHAVLCVFVSSAAAQHMHLHEKIHEECVLSCQKEDSTEPYDKFRSIYEQISLVNMTGDQQSVNICYYLLIMLPDKFMPTDCWHIHLKIYFPQLTGYSLGLRSTPFVNVKLESRRQLY